MQRQTTPEEVVKKIFFSSSFTFATQGK